MNRNTSISYLFFSILFIVLTLVPDLSVHWMFKVFPVLLLGIEVSKDENLKQKWLLFGALLTSAIGDLLLHLDLFVPGLSAFLLAQIQYAALFFQYRKSFKHRMGISTVLALYLISMLVFLLPNLGDMMIPVIAYLIVIAIMGFLSIQSSLKLKWSVLGALFFILSDSLIAINKFLFDLPYEHILVMSTYYAAQWMLVQGFLESSVNSGE